MRTPVLIAAIPVVALACGDAASSPPALTRADREAIETLHDAFARGWLENDRERVLETLTADAVLLPHWGDDPVVGREAIHAFWWPPDAPATRVLRFTMQPEEIDGAGTLAFAHGRYTLAFEVPAPAGPRRITTAGNYLMLFRRDADGWRISHRIWNDPPPR
jgi:uncharacterized protein (TIGR02246 family)